MVIIESVIYGLLE